MFTRSLAPAPPEIWDQKTVGAGLWVDLVVDSSGCGGYDEPARSRDVSYRRWSIADRLEGHGAKLDALCQPVVPTMANWCRRKKGPLCKNKKRST